MSTNTQQVPPEEDEIIFATDDPVTPPVEPPTGETPPVEPPTGETPPVEPSTGEMPPVEPSTGETPPADAAPPTLTQHQFTAALAARTEKERLRGDKARSQLELERGSNAQMKAQLDNLTAAVTELKNNAVLSPEQSQQLAQASQPVTPNPQDELARRLSSASFKIKDDMLHRMTLERYQEVQPLIEQAFRNNLISKESFLLATQLPGGDRVLEKAVEDSTTLLKLEAISQNAAALGNSAVGLLQLQQLINSVQTENGEPANVNGGTAPITPPVKQVAPGPTPIVPPQPSPPANGSTAPNYDAGDDDFKKRFTSAAW